MMNTLIRLGLYRFGCTGDSMLIVCRYFVIIMLIGMPVSGVLNPPNVKMGIF